MRKHYQNYNDCSAPDVSFEQFITHPRIQHSTNKRSTVDETGRRLVFGNSHNASIEYFQRDMKPGLTGKG